jgi:hypothetical protein
VSGKVAGFEPLHVGINPLNPSGSGRQDSNLRFPIGGCPGAPHDKGSQATNRRFAGGESAE